MKTMHIFLFPFIVCLFLISCEKEVDKVKPTIDLSIPGAFPVNCDTLYFGESFELKVLFMDNVELGSTRAFSIDIHNNFNLHAHSTEVTECNLDPKKDLEGLNSFGYTKAFNIPEGVMEHETNLSIAIPTGNAKGNFEPGDYHFFISLTDKEGWSAQKGLSIKMLYP